MGERRFENPQTVNLQSVLAASAAVHQLLADREREEEGDARPRMVSRGCAYYTVSVCESWGGCEEGDDDYLSSRLVRVYSCFGGVCRGQ